MADTNTARKVEVSAPKLSPDTFKQLRDLIYEKTGIFFQDNKTYLLEPIQRQGEAGLLTPPLPSLDSRPPG